MIADNELVKEQLLELQLIVDHLRSENSELNRRLSAQNRTGKQLADIIKAAAVILGEHVAGNPTGRQAIRKKYSYVGRRRWGWGVALLKMCYVVVDSSQWMLSFNSNLTVARAYEKLQSVTADLVKDDHAISKLRPFLPSWQR